MLYQKLTLLTLSASIYLYLQQPNLAKTIFEFSHSNLVFDEKCDHAAKVINLEALLYDVHIAIREQQGVYDLKTLMLESNHNGEGASIKFSRKHMDYTNPHIEKRSVDVKGNVMISTDSYLRVRTL